MSFLTEHRDLQCFNVLNVKAKEHWFKRWFDLFCVFFFLSYTKVTIKHCHPHTCTIYNIYNSKGFGTTTLSENNLNLLC